MKIEFRKVPQTPKDFSLEVASVKFCGTLGRITPYLVDIKSTLDGIVEVGCCKCGNNFNIPFNEKINFLVSDGIYSSNDERDLDKIIIEIDNNFIDFEEILQSEIESLRSDYHICDNCTEDSLVELEY